MSCFFNAGVSETLRQAALKKLLRLPAFNIRDGLNDYDEDYTVFEPLGDTVTSDMKFHAERKRLQQEADEARLQEEAQAEQDKTEPDEPQSDEPQSDEPAPAEPQQPAHEGVDDQQVADSDEPVHTTEQEHTDEPVPTDEPVQTDEVTPGKDAVLEPGYHSKSRSQGSSETQHHSNTLQDFPARQGDSRHGKLARTGPVKHTVAHAEKHQLNNDASRGAADNTDSEPAIDAGTHKELLS